MQMHKQRPAENFDARALHATERARARSLLELLAEARADIRQGIDPKLLEAERSVQRTLTAMEESQTSLLSGKHTAEQAATVAKEIDRLTTEYDNVLARIRQSSPRYAALTQPVPLTLKEIQTEILDQDTILLEYALGAETSFLWAVGPTSIKSFELPKRAEIEALARRVYATLTVRNRAVKDETLEQKQKRLDRENAEFQQASAALSQMVLAPVESYVGTKRLLIVSDGALQYIPFGALPLRGEVSASTRTSIPMVPVIARHEVVTLPSASVLGVLRREVVGRTPASKEVAVLADPVFDQNDPRIGNGTNARRADAAREKDAYQDDVIRSASESGFGDLVRLRFSRQEAEASTRLAPVGKKLTALDFDASRERAMSADLAQYRIVHFATPGLINSQHPELSGLVLSLVDQEGKPQNGFLRLHEIYNLHLEADLVVLSACRTALGQEIQGEGLIGLTRGFMYAGAPRVVASLWQVDDRATANLMKYFYEGMLGQGLRPAAALRSAQSSMMKDKRWQSPYYWAGFTLQGEWK
jgi:CHAT domain-containing protein